MAGYPGTNNPGTATCGGSQCGYTCNTNYVKCPGTQPICQRKTWDFEDGTTQDFFRRIDIPDLEEVSVMNSTVRHHTGTHALALPLYTMGGYIDINLPFCINATVATPTAGRSISAWFFVDGPALKTNQPSDNSISAGVWGCAPQPPDGALGCTIENTTVMTNVPVGTWFQVVAPVSATFATNWPTSSGFTISGYLYPVGATTTLYVDDVVFQ